MVVAGTGLTLSALAAPPVDTKSEALKPVAPKQLREIRKAFQDLAASVASGDAAPGAKPGRDLGQVLKNLNRPERTVTPPTLTPADVDSLVNAGLAEAKARPTRRTTDEEFVRRVCLDVTGKLPTPEQVQLFLKNKKPEKRAELIDYLLSSPDFGQNAARYWRDVIRFHATNPQIQLIKYPALETWLASQFNENKPWDETATAMITATGTPDDNGAAVLYTAHAEQRQVPAVEVAGEVSRVFLGVQIACAQCHDHPTDPWKREQFHEFAAFFAGIRARRDQGPPRTLAILANGPARHTMPDAKDPQKEGTPVEPRFFLATSESPIPKGLNAQQRRVLAASYVTGQDNVWFARSFVNHVWRGLLGDGFYNPVDDIGPDRDANNEPALVALADAFAGGGYDVKWLYRTILNTQAYQREGRSSTTAAGKVPFAANCPSRLRADQIFDALSQALDLPTTLPNRQAAGGKGKAKAKGAAAKQIARRGPRAVADQLYGVDPAMPNEDVMGTIPQALFLMNGPLIQNKIKATRNNVLGALLDAAPNNRDALDALYLRVLARKPTKEEVEVCSQYLSRVGDRREGFEDVLWSLINSTEFISRR
jgi:hypothetical protein